MPRPSQSKIRTGWSSAHLATPRSDAAAAEATAVPCARHDAFRRRSATASSDSVEVRGSGADADADADAGATADAVGRVRWMGALASWVGWTRPANCGGARRLVRRGGRYARRLRGTTAGPRGTARDSSSRVRGGTARRPVGGRAGRCGRAPTGWWRGRGWASRRRPRKPTREKTWGGEWSPSVATSVDVNPRRRGGTRGR